MLTNISNQYFKRSQQSQQPQVKNKTIDKGLTYLSYGVLVPASGFVGGKVANKQYQKNKQALSDLVTKQRHEPLDDKCFNFRDKVMATFSDLVLNEKEGHPVDMPNCLLVVGDDPKYCERMIDWIGKTSNADYKTIKNGDNILAHLEQYEENYQKTKNRTLLHVKDMESLIDHHKSEDWVVESMKDIMSAAAEDYHTTIIFQTQDPSKLDSIALQPHRVKKKFNINDIPEKKLLETDRKINEYAKNLAKLENFPKTKNKKILTGVGIGMLVGTAVATAVNCCKNLYNKKKK